VRCALAKSAPCPDENRISPNSFYESNGLISGVDIHVRYSDFGPFFSKSDRGGSADTGA
jgi:hypothetical protein